MYKGAGMGSSKGLSRKKSMIESKMNQAEYDILIQQITAESKEMWITNLFVDKPCIPICACYLWLVICLFVAGGAGWMTPVLGGSRDYNIWTDPVQIDWDIYSLAAKDISDATKEPVQFLQSQYGGSMMYIYEQKEGRTGEYGDYSYSGKGLLDLELIKKIIHAEEELINNEEFKNYCYARAPLPTDT